jgi:hypothetical protein
MIEALYPHQEQAARFLLTRTRACLFHEVGTGKTNSAISAVNRLPYGKLLILAPKCVCVGMWEKYDDLPINHDYQIVSYEFLARHTEFSRKYFDYIICDECHKLKNRKSHVAKILRCLTKNCKYAWGLTGTPYATSFLDVHGIFWALNIRAFSESYDEFMHRYYQCKVVYVNAGRFIYQPDKLLPGALNVLTAKIAQYASVLRAEDCLDLPTLTVREIEVSGMRTKEFIDAAKGIVTFADGHQETVNKLACVQKMHQLSNGFVYDAEHKPVVFKQNSKIEECMNLVQSELEERDKLIIIYVYQYDKECLTKALTDLKISYTDNTESFCSAQVLLLQEQRAIGINLQAFTSCMIFYTYSYAYLEYNQTIGRIYRAGQKIPCKIFVLINSGTSERKIWGAVQKAYDMDTTFKELMSEFR